MLLYLQKVKSLISENQYPREIQNILNSLVHYDNIPRKKPKFANFVKNSFRIRDDNLISKIWDIFQNALKANASVNDEQAVGDQQKGLKRSISETVEETKVDENINPEKKVIKMDDDEKLQIEEKTTETIKMKKVVKSFLTENSEMDIRKLKKKVIKFYHKNGFTDDTKIERKFENIIHKSTFVINESLISLAQ